MNIPNLILELEKELKKGNEDIFVFNWDNDLFDFDLGYTKKNKPVIIITDNNCGFKITRVY